MGGRSSRGGPGHAGLAGRSNMRRLHHETGAFKMTFPPSTENEDPEAPTIARRRDVVKQGWRGFPRLPTGDLDPDAALASHSARLKRDAGATFEPRVARVTRTDLTPQEQPGSNIAWFSAQK